jgi:hypothetical protein
MATREMREVGRAFNVGIINLQHWAESQILCCSLGMFVAFLDSSQHHFVSFAGGVIQQACPSPGGTGIRKRTQNEVMGRKAY